MRTELKPDVDVDTRRNSVSTVFNKKKKKRKKKTERNLQNCSETALPRRARLMCESKHVSAKWVDAPGARMHTSGPGHNGLLINLARGMEGLWATVGFFSRTVRS